MAAPDLRRRGGPGAHHRHPEAPGGHGPAVPRLSVHRHPGDGQDHLRQNSGPCRELRESPGGRPLQRVPRLPWH